MEANGRQSSSETVAILSSLLNGLQVDPTYRLPGAHAPGPRPVRPAGRHQHGHRGVGPTRGAGRVRRHPERRAREQPRQPRGVHAGPREISAPSNPAGWRDGRLTDQRPLRRASPPRLPDETRDTARHNCFTARRVPAKCPAGNVLEPSRRSATRRHGRLGARDSSLVSQAEQATNGAQCHAAGLQPVLARHGHVGPALLPSRPSSASQIPVSYAVLPVGVLELVEVHRGVAVACEAGGRWAATGGQCWCGAGSSTALDWPTWRRTTGSAARRPTGICTRASTSSPSPRRSSPCRPAPLARERWQHGVGPVEARLELGGCCGPRSPGLQRWSRR
jgi:hypothetical protein